VATVADTYVALFGTWTQHLATQRMLRSARKDLSRKVQGFRKKCVGPEIVCSSSFFVTFVENSRWGKYLASYAQQESQQASMSPYKVVSKFPQI
jgi:hypothetical protein